MKADLIKNTYLFHGIAASDLSALARIAEEKDLMAGNLIYDAGQDSDAIFIIEIGTVDIIPQGKQTPFATMGSGQSFGELAFFHPDKRVASAAARERTQLVRIPFDKSTDFRSYFLPKRLYVSRQACSRVGPGAQSPLFLADAEKDPYASLPLNRLAATYYKYASTRRFFTRLARGFFPHPDSP